MELSEILQTKRKKLNMSLREASEFIGISHSYLNKLENGYDSRSKKANKPTPETLRLIADAYKTDYNLLMEVCGYIRPDNELKPNDEQERELLNLFRICGHDEKLKVLGYIKALADIKK